VGAGRFRHDLAQVVQDCRGRRDTFAVDAIVEELEAFEQECRRGAGTGIGPCAVGMRPPPSSAAPHGQDACRWSMSYAAPTISAIESNASTSWKFTSSGETPSKTP
jgi:hypothetical protein